MPEIWANNHSEYIEASAAIFLAKVQTSPANMERHQFTAKCARCLLKPEICGMESRIPLGTTSRKKPGKSETRLAPLPSSSAMCICTNR